MGSAGSCWVSTRSCFYWMLVKESNSVDKMSVLTDMFYKHTVFHQMKTVH